jgi:hypothetical protein
MILFFLGHCVIHRVILVCDISIVWFIVWYWHCVIHRVILALCDSSCDIGIVWLIVWYWHCVIHRVILVCDISIVWLIVWYYYIIFYIIIFYSPIYYTYHYFSHHKTCCEKILINSSYIYILCEMYQAKTDKLTIIFITLNILSTE